MQPCARQLAAIRHELTDRISVDAIHVEIQDQIAEFLHVEQEAVLDSLGLDGRIVAAPYTGQLPLPIDGVALNEWGTPNSGMYGYGTGRYSPLSDAESISEVERYPWPGALPLYVGDDDKDEEAFGVVQAQGGVAVLVAALPRATAAQLRLDTPRAARRWLEGLLVDRRASGTGDPSPSPLDSR